MNEKKAIRLCAMGLGICVSILVSCLMIDMGLIGRLLMAIGLLALAAGTIGLFKQRQYSVAVLALIVTLSVVQFSRMEWYVPHTDGSIGGHHRHSIWDMGHVH